MSVAADDEAQQRAFAAADRRQDDPEVRRRQEENLRATWKPPSGWRYWSGVNNDMVGQWYTATSFVFMIFARILALIVRAQLAAPESDLVSAEFYNQAFTLHGTAMMFLFAVPIFEAVAILFAFPPLIAGYLLFELERAFDWPFFDHTRAGDPLLWQHLFWIFGHPEVYIIFLPSIALLAMIVPTFAQRPMVGYSWIVLSAVGTGFLSFGLWVHHMFTTGMPSISLAFFSAASEAVAIPTGIQLFVFIATLLLGKVVRSTPLLFASGALSIFVLGGLTGVMVAVAPFDFQVHDTYFIVAHLHYTILGGVVFPLLAGVYYFYPMVRKRLLSDRLGRSAFWLLFVGFNVCFLPMHLTGMIGMPRCVYTYPAGMGWDWLNLISTVGAFVIAAGSTVFFTDFFLGRRWQREAGKNPWNAGTLEWVAEDGWGIRSVPVIETRYPLRHQKDFARKVWEGRFYMPDAQEGKREAMVSTVLDAEPLQCLRVPGPSWLPFWSAVFTGGFFILATYHWWVLTLTSGALALGCILAWLWTGTAVIPEKPRREVGLGL